MYVPVGAVSGFRVLLDTTEDAYLVSGPFLTIFGTFFVRVVSGTFLCPSDYLQHLFKPHRRHQDLIFGVLALGMFLTKKWFYIDTTTPGGGRLYWRALS